MRRVGFFLCLLMLAGAPAVSPSAEAGPFTKKTMRADMAPDRAGRELVLPKGWTQVELLVENKSTSRVRGGDGQVYRLDGTARWDYGRLVLGVEHGFSRFTTLYARVPWVRAHLRTVNESSIGTIALGDAHLGMRVQPWLGRRWGVAFRVDLKTPSGADWPSESSGQPHNVDGFLTGTGLVNLGLFAEAKLRPADPVAFLITAGYTLKLPAIVGYVVEVDGFGNGKLDAGDAVDADLSILLQPHQRFSFSAGARFSYRGWYKVGAAGPGLGWFEPYFAVEDGWFLDVYGDLTIDTGPVFALSVLAAYQVAGTSTEAFSILGLEEFSPQPGLTLGLKGTVRW